MSMRYLLLPILLALPAFAVPNIPALGKWPPWTHPKRPAADDNNKIDRYPDVPICKYIPGDAGWPSPQAWARLNDTIDGRLLATLPLARVCHQSGDTGSGPFSAYNSTACNDVKTAFLTAGPAILCVLTLHPILSPSSDGCLSRLKWGPVSDAASRNPTPGEILNPYWQNETCSPFTGPQIQCTLGNRAVYSINVTGVSDVQAGIAFAARHNVRLVVRNTGIE
jgi:hypothetical protein